MTGKAQQTREAQWQEQKPTATLSFHSRSEEEVRFDLAPKGSTVFPNSASSQGPSVQTFEPEPMGNISHLNHKDFEALVTAKPGSKESHVSKCAPYSKKNWKQLSSFKQICDYWPSQNARKTGKSCFCGPTEK